MNKPVFIIGLHRAGSTLLKNILDASLELSMAPEEMQLFWPWKKDFIDYAKQIGDLKDDHNLIELFDLVYSGNIEAAFWNEWKKLAIKKEKILERIIKSDRSYKSIITIFLDEYANYENKKRFGAKYLVHYSKTDILLDWFPDCKIIHLTRDPRAICASKVNDDATNRRKKKCPPLKYFIHYGTLLFFVWEYIRSAKIHERFKKKEDYYLLRYEDLISEPEKTIRNLCAFSELEFLADMLFASGKPSSYKIEQKGAFDISRMYRWQDHMPQFDINLVTSLTKNAMIKLGYGNIDVEYKEWKHKFILLEQESKEGL